MFVLTDPNSVSNGLDADRNAIHEPVEQPEACLTAARRCLYKPLRKPRAEAAEDCLCVAVSRGRGRDFDVVLLAWAGSLRCQERIPGRSGRSLYCTCTCARFLRLHGTGNQIALMQKKIYEAFTLSVFLYLSRVFIHFARISQCSHIQTTPEHCVVPSMSPRATLY